MRPVFADPKTDFVFKRLFGSEPRIHLLLALLNDLLETDAQHQIVSVQILPPELKPSVQEAKLSIVDVRCTDAQGTTYVIEMQILPVEGFDKRVVYNACKSYTGQLRGGEEYPQLDDVVAVSICDFELWPRASGSAVPLLSRWKMRETHSGSEGMGHIQYVFLELPKYDPTQDPRTEVERWAYFFREASELEGVPRVLKGTVMGKALEEARTAGFTLAEWEAYERDRIALQDARGALTMAHRLGLERGRREGRAEGEAKGRAEGEARGKAEAVLAVLVARGLEVTEEQREHILSATSATVLEGWLRQAISATSTDDLFS
ncbi:MAG: Rpn family recombination-promoting nuclease/putative transposase [Polyangiaceae bacterium]|jgi:predicted transposase/invertase (TIGR01784 family)|nr:Rpn family recombination-promoting nuclease/putative transposase [Polyangiaceae bacterium]